jgi:hypothetical protein
MNDNKLIAEFMGRDDVYQGMSEARAKRIYNYHTSWDWLVPVIIKISSLTEDGVKIEDYETIQSAYHFVVEFIKANKYPFNEGDDYWVVEDGNLMWGVWDDASEDMHDENPNRKYFTEEEAIDYARAYGIKYITNNE